MSEIEVPEVLLPHELVDIRTGALVEATAENAAELLGVVREMRNRMLGLVRDCELVLLEESRRQGTKTLNLEHGKAVITGGSETDWDIELLGLLRDAGLPEDRFNELVKTTVSYKVDARVAKQLEASNPAYAEVIDAARVKVEKPWRVSLR